MKRILLAFFMTLSAICVSLSASAATTLRVATWLPPTHPMNAEALPTWAKWVEEATEGRVVVKLEYDLGHPKSYFDLVEDGVVDAGWSLHGYVPGRFVSTELAEQPAINADAEASSVAYWRVNEKYLAEAEEHDGLELLALFTNGPSVLHLRESVNTIDDLKGLKIRAPGGIAAAVGEELNVTNVNAPAPKIYEMLQQGVVDGVFIALLDQKALRLNEVTTQVIDYPGGLFRGSFSVFMNEDFMYEISKKDRDAIASVSGEKLSAMIGRVWSKADSVGLAAAEERNVDYVKLTADSIMAKDISSRIAGVSDEWVERADDKGFDAKAALTEYRQIAESYQSEL
ncbi:TRAP transporter substrate-binding protein [Photobacterium minamisatsumaniensis]|uniref:TRAP transporter substrate-binding protein n=1 Tax=Photobacterium minamisatsumaniensis TaxID=2910233 RepID=UPI003D10B5B5